MYQLLIHFNDDVLIMPKYKNFDIICLEVTLMLIRRFENKIKIYDGIEVIGTLKYTVEDNIVYLNSVQVDPNYRNHGYARLLVLDAIEFIRELNLKAKPVCPYIESMFKAEDYSDIEV